MTGTTAQHQAEAEMRSGTGGRASSMVEAAPIAEIAPSFYEQVYRDAAGDMSRVRWADGRANPSLVSWLNTEAHGLVRPGSRVVVVGCGLGDDLCELADRGYDVQGFDVAPTAINWARQRFPSLAKNMQVADLFNLPPRLRHRFDLVVEIYTMQSIDPSLREQAALALASLATPHGVVLTICRGRDETDLLEHVQGPPWPLTCSELTGLMEMSGLRPLRAPDDFMDDADPAVRRIRGTFVRA